MTSNCLAKNTLFTSVRLLLFAGLVAFMSACSAAQTTSQQPTESTPSSPQTVTLPKGKDILLAAKLPTMKFTKEGVGSVKGRKMGGDPTADLTFEVLEKPTNSYNLSFRMPIQETEVSAGEILYIAFQGRALSTQIETGEARARFMVQTDDATKNEQLEQIISLPNDWKQYHIPLKFKHDDGKVPLQIALQFGFGVQKFLMKDIQVVLYDKTTDFDALPITKTTYQGMEPDAQWRKEAQARIEQIRKGDFDLQLIKNGKPVSGAKVQVELKRHYFGWGAAIGADEVVNKPAFLKRYAEDFNMAVFENDLKNKPWTKKPDHSEVLKAINLLQLNQVQVKGHVLIWPGFQYLSPAYKGKNAQTVTSMTEAHLKDILTATAGKISRWDVVNEAYTNTDLQEVTGSNEILALGFKEAKRLQPEAARFVNEYGIISRGGLDTKKQDWYYGFVQEMDKLTGGLVDGIGFQSHIGSDLTPPERVLNILDRYATLKKKLCISEFTMDVTTPDVREQYTRDFLTATFSHPAVTEFLFWGHNTGKSDIYRADGMPGVMGKAFFDLVHKEWKTRITDKTNAQGMVKSRGFYGKYSCIVEINGKKQDFDFEILPGAKTVVELEWVE
jgi:endo-1,4-beta-xylanase